MASTGVLFGGAEGAGGDPLVPGTMGVINKLQEELGELNRMLRSPQDPSDVTYAELKALLFPINQRPEDIAAGNLGYTKFRERVLRTADAVEQIVSEL